MTIKLIFAYLVLITFTSIIHKTNPTKTFAVLFTVIAVTILEIIANIAYFMLNIILITMGKHRIDIKLHTQKHEDAL
jgi:hypothetical protein